MARDLTRRRIHAFLVSKLTAGLARETVRIIYATLRRLLSVAVNDGLYLANPAAKLGRELSLVVPPRERQERIKAFTDHQLKTFLETTAREARSYAPLFATLAGAGLRLGEGLGLQWSDLNLAERKIRIQRTISRGGREGTPKAGFGRTVNMADVLAKVLQRAHMRLPERMKRNK